VNGVGATSTGDRTVTTDITGKFRMIRAGTTLTAYIWQSGAWSQFKQWTGADVQTDDVTLQLYNYVEGGLPTVEVHYDNFVVNKGVITATGFGCKFATHEVINKVIFLHTDSTLVNIAVYNSLDNGNNYALVDDNNTGNLEITENSQSYYQYFAVDLEKRHYLEIIRSYGTATNNVFLNRDNKVDYSNTDTSNVDSVVWDNSTYEDARWVRIKLLCGDWVAKTIRKLGIYPDITSAFCSGGGGYNCEWVSLGTRLTDYDIPINVAYNAVVTGTNNYFNVFYPSNAVDGVFTEHTPEACWGFETEDSEDPYLEMIFDDAYTINRIDLYHALSPTDEDYTNVDYNLRVAYSEYNPGSLSLAYGTPQYNNGALEFNGSTDYIKVKYVSDLDFNADDFQINVRVSFNSVVSGTTQCILHRAMPIDTDGTDLLRLQLDGTTSKFRAFLRNSSEISCVDIYSTTVVVADTLYDVALVRDSYTFRLFVDGVQEANYYIEQYVDTPSTSLNIGADPVDGDYLDGSIEELRFSSIATWSGSGNYTPEVGDYTSIAGTFLLFHFDGEIYFEILSVTGNSDNDVIHYFTPTLAHRALFTITDYDSTSMYVPDTVAGTIDAFTGSFLREIEIYTYTDLGYVDSETWPVVCVNLQSQFNVLNHALINKDVTDTDTDWNNDDSYFKYSDSVLDDPQKVSFTRAGSEVNVYYSSSSSGDIQGAGEYIFEENVYIPAGIYSVSCQMYDVDSIDEMSLTIEGNETIDIFPTAVAGGAWQDVKDLITISIDGFYTVKGKQYIDSTDHWGIRYPRIYRAYGLSRWVAVKRDTATNYAWDDDSDKYGIDYLTLIKVFGDTQYKPLEYSWWWTSTLSTLSNDYLIVREDSRSLKISYPTSSGIDSVALREGDDFGHDIYWSVKDYLTFDIYIEDVTKLDTSYGDITFGILYDNPKSYYIWNIENMNLVTGWNSVRLKFEDYDTTYPVVEDYYLQSFMDESLDFRAYGKDMTSFRFRYRGVGEAFNMYMCNLKIERNTFDDTVKFGKGLCLNNMEYLEIPLNGLTLERGTIEFWLKPYYDSYGIDIFNYWNSRTLFTITNNNNNIIALAVKAGNWFELTSGHVRRECQTFIEYNERTILQNYVERNELIHLAVSWSNDGTYTDNKDTVRFYVNGVLMYTSKQTWEVSDTKFALIKLGGGNTQLASAYETFGGGIFDNIKIYDYCKDNFNINTEGIEKDISYTANQFTEISDDNITFHGVGSAGLPLIFTAVPADASRTVYVRSNKNDFFKTSTKTATLLVSWLTTV
jgi:hypothetical protein